MRLIRDKDAANESIEVRPLACSSNNTPAHTKPSHTHVCSIISPLQQFHNHSAQQTARQPHHVEGGNRARDVSQLGEANGIADDDSDAPRHEGPREHHRLAQPLLQGPPAACR